MNSDSRPSNPQSEKMRVSYDTIAAEYANRIYPELKSKPFDRELLDRFADDVRMSGPVCDIGCGPAQIARYLFDRGVNVFGLDLSAGMLNEAKRLNPNIDFIQGSMLALGLGSDTLGGIAAFYSIIHIGREHVVATLSEMRRVLKRKGSLLLAFHLGDDVIHMTDFHDHPVDFEATLFRIEEMTGYAKAAGLNLQQAMERDPYPEVEYQSRRGYILATKS
jgi:SAM-dependent methyltransferase